MIKTRQKNMRIFEFESIDRDGEYLAFITRNLPILKGFTLLFHQDINIEIKNILNTNSISYIIGDILTHSSTPSTQISTHEATPKEQSPLIPKAKEQSSSTLIVDKVVRSGEVIENDGDIIVLSQVNNGARIISAGNISAYDKIDGVLEMKGRVLFLSGKAIESLNNVKQGKILLKDNIITDDMLEINKKSKLGGRIFVLGSSGEIKYKDI